VLYFMSGVVHSLPLGSKQEIAKLPLIGTELFTPLMGGVGTMFEIVPIFVTEIELIE